MPYKKGECRDHRKGHVKTKRAETGAMWPQARECWESSGAGRSREDPPLEPPGGSTALLLTPSALTSDPQNCGRRNLCCSEHWSVVIVVVRGGDQRSPESCSFTAASGCRAPQDLTSRPPGSQGYMQRVQRFYASVPCCFSMKRPRGASGTHLGLSLWVPGASGGLAAWGRPSQFCLERWPRMLPEPGLGVPAGQRDAL